MDNHCDLELNNALTITPKHILIKNEDETLIDIYDDKMVFVRGDLIELDSKQQKLVTEYAASLRAAIPDIGEIAIEAVDIAFQGIQAAFGQMPENSKLSSKFDEIKTKIKDKYESEDSHYSFSNGEFNHQIDGSGIDESVEELMEDMIPSLIGGLISNIGNSIANGESSFSDLDNLDDRIEQEIESRADEIEIKANKFCEKLKLVDKMEDELTASNSKFANFDLIKINENDDYEDR
ncbi:DUF2884 family protein [Psychrosphaera algicola]|uniref:DUF2884 family protein n=1 Tax=Psychrosphaera algicola TaxID=3023714 RepID=A0ABT5F8N0_9GAMM|nr:DUF2884 family protein [Psychrosphaera sp. G1-22]MDC2887896.1 DUF2884 family protein [Psychrosphaera sp. G1-22]